MEQPVAEAHPLLHEDDRTARFEPDRDHDQRHQRQHHGQRQDSEHEIEDPLQNLVGERERAGGDDQSGARPETADRERTQCLDLGREYLGMDVGALHRIGPGTAPLGRTGHDHPIRISQIPTHPIKHFRIVEPRREVPVGPR